MSYPYGFRFNPERGSLEVDSGSESYIDSRGRNERKYFVDDTGRFANTNGDRDFLSKEWFQLLRTKWSANLDDLNTYTTKIQIRYNSSGHSAIKYDHYPLQYKV